MYGRGERWEEDGLEDARVEVAVLDSVRAGYASSVDRRNHPSGLNCELRRLRKPGANSSRGRPVGVGGVGEGKVVSAAGEVTGGIGSSTDSETTSAADPLRERLE